MEAVLNRFQNELSDLKQLINFYEAEGKLLADFNLMNLPKSTGWCCCLPKFPFVDYSLSREGEVLLELSSKLKAFSTAKRVFNYNSIIISLYGAFERFIEDCIISYVDSVGQLVSDYDKLPISMANNHFDMSIALLSKISQKKYHGSLTRKDIISNLHSCMILNTGYLFNTEAFVQHEANFRVGEIDTAFRKLGIENLNNKILQTKNFRDYSLNRLQLDDTAVLSQENGFELLNGLADKRNDVAHGVRTSILTNDILLDYVTFFEIYSTVLINVLNPTLLYIERDTLATDLGEITDVFENGIVCVKTNNVPIKLGDVLFGGTENQIVKTKILGMKLYDNVIESVDDKESYEIGIKIDQKFKKNFKVSVLRQKDTV